jgi:hypothetical protein
MCAVVWSDVRAGFADPQSVANAYFNVEINADRSALQVLGCADHVLAHLPLPNEVTGSGGSR